MEVLGVKFAPLNTPIQRRLQTLAAGTWFFTFAAGGLLGSLIELYLILYTKYWWLALIYAAWIYLDKDISEQGGRPIQWARNWQWWVYLRDYFPVTLKKLPECNLDPNRNYLFAYFPHGMLGTGAFNAFASNSSEFSQLFPHHQPRVCTLAQHYMMPFFREIGLSVGGISPSAKSIQYVLNQPGGGYVLGLLPGGAAEAYYCQPNQYKILLKRRKGFIRMALIAGSPLVPVIGFGEPDLFTQFDGPILRRVQEFLRKFIGLAPIIPLGRGFLQYSFGIVPQRRPVTTVVGNPIDVVQTPQPSTEQIDELHKKFIGALEKLFESQKHKYLENAENIHIEL